jgi:hypothetical protein
VIEKPFKPTLQVTFFSLYGAAGLVLAAFIHVGSFGAMVLPANSGPIWLMHIGVFPLIFAFVIRVREWQQPDQGWNSVQSLLPPRELSAYFPWWAIVFVLALFFYAILNFFLATGALTGSVGARELSPAQGARAFSGHWMIFYGLPAVFFGFVPPEARPSRDAAA